MKTKYPSTIKTVWEVWSDSDVWGNDEDGYTVNDRTCIDRALELTLPVKIANEGGPREFAYAEIEDSILAEIFGVELSELVVDGDDVNYDISLNDGYPIGTLTCESHESLSPLTFEYNYIVDIDERGQYSAHVEDCNGDEVYKVSNEDEDDESDEISLIRDGFMKHTGDMGGLHDYLVECGIIPADSVMKYNG